MTAMAMAGLLGSLGGLPGGGLMCAPRPNTTGKKCLLPGCDILTLHNGGYCCAEHCLEHRAILKRKP